MGRRAGPSPSFKKKEHETALGRTHSGLPPCHIRVSLFLVAVEMPTSDDASASGPQPGPYPCASIDGCDFSHLAPSDQHMCNGGCLRPTHNLCNQKLRGNHDKAPDGIKCGWIVCAAGYNEQQKAELLVKLRQLREEAAAKAAAKAAEVEQQGGGCAAGENCLVPDGDPDKLTVDCAHGRKKQFKCQNRDCSSTCGKPLFAVCWGYCCVRAAVSFV